MLSHERYLWPYQERLAPASSGFSAAQAVLWVISGAVLLAAVIYLTAAIGVPPEFIYMG